MLSYALSPRLRRPVFPQSNFAAALRVVVTGACALMASLAVSCAADAYSGEPAPGTIPGYGVPQGNAGTPAAVAGSGASGSASCPTFQDDFLPQIHTPVCSKCHGSDPRLRNWGDYATAASACGRIGAAVGGGSMPPRSSGLSLTADQRALVANWVSLGCPESASTLPASCSAGTGITNPGGPQPAPATPPTSTAPQPPLEPGEDPPGQ
jgi:hypothetical protein